MADGEQVPPVDEGARSAARFIETLGQGQCVLDLSHELNKLGKELRDRWLDIGGGAKGEVTLKISGKIDGDGVVKMTYDVKSKLPVDRKPGSIFWVTPGGNFVTENPKQKELEFGPRVVPAPKQEAREITPKQEERGV
jgi:hypothetical protein